MKICIQGAGFDTGNMGVSALAVGSVQAVLHSFPGAKVFFLNYAKCPTTYRIRLAGGEMAVPLVNMRFSWRVWLTNNIAWLLFLTLLMKLLPFRALRRRWIAGNNCLRHLHESDLVLAISGGDSFSDIYGLERLIYVSLPQVLAIWAGKRLVLLPQTLGPFNRRLAKALARYIMRRAETVYSRDHAGVEQSAAVLNLNGHAAKLRFCYDVGFLLDPIPPDRVDIVGLEDWREKSGDRNLEAGEEQQITVPDLQTANPVRDFRMASRLRGTDSGRPLVGLNVSGLLTVLCRSRRNPFGLRVEYDRLVQHLVQSLVEQEGANVLLIPHFFGIHEENESTLCEQIYEGLPPRYHGRVGWVRGEYNQSEIKYIIGQCDFFVGSRMHACIAAISQGIPAVAIAYSGKFAGVMESVGVGSIVVDARKLGLDEILRAVEKAFGERDAVRAELARRVPQVKQTVLGMFALTQGAPA